MYFVVKEAQTSLSYNICHTLHLEVRVLYIVAVFVVVVTAQHWTSRQHDLVRSSTELISRPSPTLKWLTITVNT